MCSSWSSSGMNTALCGFITQFRREQPVGGSRTSVSRALRYQAASFPRSELSPAPRLSGPFCSKARWTGRVQGKPVPALLTRGVAAAANLAAGSRPDRSRAASYIRPCEAKFAVDSLLEGAGFEPSVPHKKQPFLAAAVRSRNSPSATKTGSFLPGTDGSNPSPSSEESGANLVPFDQLHESQSAGMRL